MSEYFDIDVNNNVFCLQLLLQERTRNPPFSGIIVHDPMDASSPNRPHFPLHVGINVPKAASHVPATIKIRNL